MGLLAGTLDLITGIRAALSDTGIADRIRESAVVRVHSLPGGIRSSGACHTPVQELVFSSDHALRYLANRSKSFSDGEEIRVMSMLSSRSANFTRLARGLGLIL